MEKSKSEILTPHLFISEDPIAKVKRTKLCLFENKSDVENEPDDFFEGLDSLTFDFEDFEFSKKLDESESILSIILTKRDSDDEEKLKKTRRISRSNQKCIQNNSLEFAYGDFFIEFEDKKFKSNKILEQIILDFNENSITSDIMISDHYIELVLKSILVKWYKNIDNVTIEFDDDVFRRLDEVITKHSSIAFISKKTEPDFFSDINGFLASRSFGIYDYTITKRIDRKINKVTNHLDYFNDHIKKIEEKTKKNSYIFEYKENILSDTELLLETFLVLHSYSLYNLSELIGNKLWKDEIDYRDEELLMLLIERIVGGKIEYSREELLYFLETLLLLMYQLNNKVFSLYIESINYPGFPFEYSSNKNESDELLKNRVDKIAKNLFNIVSTSRYFEKN
ncbi:hypothetical protein [Exiguobacterium acetylicum]|uniref:hypothetical protein n=1 Tax=Exiguobacterium acetylicum TaxID=41170 RepID=UPI001EE37334|nr:hypothetical protein [Exiguobacterium acetylicum]UKS57749.1 hypothetical protein K6T22_16825 [Exiguobacterium acetylicum]